MDKNKKNTLASVLFCNGSAVLQGLPCKVLVIGVLRRDILAMVYYIQKMVARA